MVYSDDLKMKILKIVKLKKFTDTEIINMFRISRDTFYKIKKNPKIKSHSKYSNPKTHNRKTKITIYIKNFIVKYVTAKVNFDYRKLITIINNKYGVSIGKASIFKILKDKGITKKKILNKQILTNTDTRFEQIKTFKKKIKNAIKKSSIENIISIDETSIDSHICNTYGWSKRGTRIKNIISHKKIRYSLILAINCNKIIHKEIIKGSVNGEIFLKFIKDLVKKLQIKNTNYVLLDNARIHRYGKVTDFINGMPKIKLIYNIPYTPEKI